MNRQAFRKARLPKSIAGERRPVTTAQCRRGMLSAALLSTFCLLIAAFETRATSSFDGTWQMLATSLLILAVFMPYFYWKSLLRRIRRGERFETVYFAPTPAEAKDQLMRARAVVLTFFVAGALTIYVFWSSLPTLPGLVVPMLLMVAAWWSAAIGTFLCSGPSSRKLRSKIQVVSPIVSPITTAATANALSDVNAVNISTSRAEHWWTDTPLREETKVEIRR